MVIVMLTGSRFLPYIVAIPKRILMPIVVVICVLGSYALELRISHVYQMFAFGITGLVMRRYGFPVGPMVLAIILGGLLDVEIRRSILLAQKGLFALFMGRPLSLFLIFVIAFSLLSRLDFIREIFRKPLNRIKEKVFS
jgi:putative tricarboxylic transport membrane protein